MNALFTDTTWDDSFFSEVDVVVLGITKEEVTSCDIGKALSRLMLLSDQREWVEKFNGSLALVFIGYDEDKRELPMIPEVQAYMRALTKQWPFWFHFLSREHGQISLVLLMLCDCEAVASANNAIGYHVDATQRLEVVEALYRGIYLLHSTYDLPYEVNICANERVADALFNTFL